MRLPKDLDGSPKPWHAELKAAQTYSSQLSFAPLHIPHLRLHSLSVWPPNRNTPSWLREKQLPTGLVHGALVVLGSSTLPLP